MTKAGSGSETLHRKDLVAELWLDLLGRDGLSPVRELLPAYLVRQRWFGAKSRTISGVRVLDWVELPAVPAAIVFVEVAYAEGDSDTYQMPLALSSGAEASSRRRVSSTRRVNPSRRCDHCRASSVSRSSSVRRVERIWSSQTGRAC